MKKNVYALLLCYTIISGSITVHSQTTRKATIEPGTKARLVLQSRISSNLNEIGDKFIATLQEPIYVNQQMVIPRDAEFHGRVTAVKPSGRSHKSAEMTVVFDRVLTPWGEEPVEVTITAIDDWENDRKYKADSEGKVDGGHRGKETADNVSTGSEIGRSGARVTRLGNRGCASRKDPVGGAAIAGAMISGLLLTKGGDVRLEPGAILRIEFVKSLTLPVIEQRIP